jgi:hypothetical protein
MEKRLFSYFIRDLSLAKEPTSFYLFSLLQLRKQFDVIYVSTSGPKKISNPEQTVNLKAKVATFC